MATPSAGHDQNAFTYIPGTTTSSHLEREIPPFANATGVKNKAVAIQTVYSIDNFAASQSPILSVA